MKQEYSVDSALGHLSTHSDKIKQLEVANTYNFMLYMVHYTSHLEQLETLKNVGDLQEMSAIESMELMPGIETLQASE